MSPTNLSGTLQLAESLDRDVDPVAHPAANQDRRTSMSAGRLSPHTPVLHLINGQHYSGAERVQDLLAKCLPSHGFDVTFACLKPGLFPTQRQTTSSPLYQLPMRSRFDLRAVRHVAALVRRDSYRILHAHTPRTAMICRLVSARCGVPMVYHVHSPTSRDCDRPVRNWVNNTVERLGLSKAARLIAVSQSLASHMQHLGYSRERICVVPNGVPTANAKGARRPRTNTWVLGTVALFRPRKGMEVLLQATARLRRQGLDVTLRAVGPFETPEYEAHLKREVDRLGIREHVRWVGFTRDVSGELAKMDLFILPSLYGEGLPMVILEAMAAGVPVVATRVEGIPEVIRDAIDGLVVTPGDAVEMADAIAEIARGRVCWESLRENSILRHAQLFSDEGMAAGVARVYHEVLGMD